MGFRLKINYYQTKAAVGNYGKWAVGNGQNRTVSFIQEIFMLNRLVFEH